MAQNTTSDNPPTDRFGRFCSRAGKILMFYGGLACAVALFKYMHTADGLWAAWPALAVVVGFMLWAAN